MNRDKTLMLKFATQSRELASEARPVVSKGHAFSSAVSSLLREVARNAFLNTIPISCSLSEPLSARMEPAPSLQKELQRSDKPR